MEKDKNVAINYTSFDKYAKFITKSIGILVSDQRCKYDQSVRGFAKNINVSSTVVSDLENGTKIPRMETILKILWSLNIPFEKVFSETVLPPKEFEDTTKKHIMLQKYLTQEGLSKQDIKDIMDYIAFKKQRSEK